MQLIGLGDDEDTRGKCQPQVRDGDDRGMDAEADGDCRRP